MLADWTPPPRVCAPVASNRVSVPSWKVTSSTSPRGPKAALAERTLPPRVWAPETSNWVRMPLGETTTSTCPWGLKATLTDPTGCAEVEGDVGCGAGLLLLENVVMTMTVAGAEVAPLSSPTVYVKLSLPLEFALGV